MTKKHSSNKKCSLLYTLPILSMALATVEAQELPEIANSEVLAEQVTPMSASQETPSSISDSTLLESTPMVLSENTATEQTTDTNAVSPAIEKNEEYTAPPAEAVPHSEKPYSGKMQDTPTILKSNDKPSYSYKKQSSSQDLFQIVAPSVEVKFGYFFFSDSKMRDVYNKGGFDVQLCGTYPIWKGLQVYGSVEYLQRSGHSLHVGDSTEIWEVPLSLGLRGIITICPTVQYYATLGPRYIFVQAKTHSATLDHTVSANGCGGFVNTGFNFFVIPHLFIDIFGEYSFKQMEFDASKPNVYGRTIDVGGFTFGGGVGYSF